MKNLGPPELRNLYIGKGKSFFYGLEHLFNKSFEIGAELPNEPIMSYVLGRTSKTTIPKATWSYYQSLLIQSICTEPGLLPKVLIEVEKYAVMHGAFDRDALKQALQSVIMNHATQGNNSEIAWAIWGSILFGIPIDEVCVKQICEIEDSVIALLSLDARSQGLMPKGWNPSLWASLMTDTSIENEHWLLGYEALMHGWLKPVGVKDYVKAHPMFSELQRRKIHFYGYSAVLLPAEWRKERKESKAFDPARIEHIHKFEMPSHYQS